jgi:hypothetical protein
LLSLQGLHGEGGRSRRSRRRKARDAAENAKCERDDPGEKVVSDPVAGYFLGAKGSLAFFQAPDGFNGGMPFVVIDTASMKKLFDDSFEGADFEKVDNARRQA